MPCFTPKCMASDGFICTWIAARMDGSLIIAAARISLTDAFEFPPRTHPFAIHLKQTVFVGSASDVRR